MPSDCQCSTACMVNTHVIDNEKATRRIQRLELEVTKLKDKNLDLKKRLEVANVNKKILIKKLKDQLDKI